MTYKIFTYYVMFVLSTDLFKIKDQMYFHIFPTQASVFLGLHTESMTAMKHSGLRRKNVLAERLKGAPDLSTVTSIPIWLLYVCHSLVLPNQSFCFGARLSCVFFFPAVIISQVPSLLPCHHQFGSLSCRPGLGSSPLHLFSGVWG